MYFYIVRHGQTLFNQKGMIQGWVDSPLTQKGIEQALRAGERLKDIHFDHVYSSTSERAMDTCHYISKREDIISYKAFKERYFGTLEAEKIEAVIKEIGSVERLDSYAVENGAETAEEVADRFIKQLKECAKECSESCLVVAHGMCIMHTLEAIDKAKFYKLLDGRIGLSNCAISIVEYTDHFELKDIWFTE